MWIGSHRALAAILVVVVLSVFAAPSRAQEAARTRGSDYAALPREAWTAVRDNYLDPSYGGVDWAAVGREYLGRSPAARDEAYDVIRSMLGRLGDPSVRFLAPEGWQALQADFAGVPRPGLGLTELLSVDIGARTRTLTIVTPEPNTPAARAGLQSGDVIAAIDGVATDTLDLGRAAVRMRGPVGSPVRLTIRRGDRRFDVTLTQEMLPALSDSAIGRARHEGGLTIGYVDFVRFVPGVSTAVRRELERLMDDGVDAWLLDLRNDGGGAVDELVALAEMFLGPDRPIASLPGRTDTLRLRTSEPALTDLPLAVLVNTGSASAAEALSGALQANERAVVIGEPTFRKGLAHSAQPLSDGSVVMVPIGRLKTPRGRDILDEGIAPDIVAHGDRSPKLDPGLEVAGPDDVLYQRAVEWLKDRLRAHRSGGRR